MRKKIPTITRPDPAYAASLRPEVEEDPGREAMRRAAAMAGPVSVELASAGDQVAGHPTTQPERPSQPRQEAGTGLAPAVLPSPSRPQRSPETRKIDIRVNALERQEEGLIDCGVDPAHAIRAALRRAVKNWALGSEFVPPPEEQRTRITEWRARTSLAVDAPALTALQRAHDPLDVLSKWALVRGQIEPRVWAEIDILLDEIAVRAAAQNARKDTPET